VQSGFSRCCWAFNKVKQAYFDLPNWASSSVQTLWLQPMAIALWRGDANRKNKQITLTVGRTLSPPPKPTTWAPLQCTNTRKQSPLLILLFKYNLWHSWQFEHCWWKLAAKRLTWILLNRREREKDKHESTEGKKAKQINELTVFEQRSLLFFFFFWLLVKAYFKKKVRHA